MRYKKKYFFHLTFNMVYLRLREVYRKRTYLVIILVLDVAIQIENSDTVKIKLSKICVSATLD